MVFAKKKSYIGTETLKSGHKHTVLELYLKTLIQCDASFLFGEISK